MNSPAWAVVIRQSINGEPPPAMPIEPGVDIQFGSGTPGGYAEASVGIADDLMGRPTAYLPTPVQAPTHGDFTILANGASCFNGAIVGRRRVDGYVRGVSAQGYGQFALRSDWYRGGAGASSTAHAIALDVLRTLAPTLSIGDVDGPSTPYSAAEFVGRAPNEIIEQLSRAGEDGIPWLMTVYDRVIAWLPAVAPAMPTYRVTWAGVTSDEDDTKIYGTGSLSLALPDGTSQLLTRTSPGGNDRHIHLDANDSSVTAGSAFLETWLAQHQEPTTSISLTRDYDHWLERSDGGQTPPWLVRAGETIQVGDDPIRFITKTQFSAKDGTVNIQCGPPPRRSFMRIINDAREVAGSLRSGSDILTVSHARR